MNRGIKPNKGKIKKGEGVLVERKPKVRSVCLVCNGAGKVNDAKTRKSRDCAVCRGAGIVMLER